MAATESSAGRILKGETAAAIQRAAGTKVVQTARDHWGDQFVSVRHRGCKVHWGPGQSKKYLEVVLAHGGDERGSSRHDIRGSSGHDQNARGGCN